jgi:hypothetical protein
VAYDLPEGTFVMTKEHRRLILTSTILVILAAILVFRHWRYSSTPSIRIAQNGVAHFRSQMKAEEFQAIYAEADEVIRQKRDKESFANLMAAIERGTGPHKQTRLSRARESWFSRPDKYVTLNYETTWARTKGEEKFVFLIRQGHATLNSYLVSAPYPSVLSLP